MTYYLPNATGKFHRHVLEPLTVTTAYELLRSPTTGKEKPSVQIFTTGAVYNQSTKITHLYYDFQERRTNY
jgi:hypothetical protein